MEAGSRVTDLDRVHDAHPRVHPNPNGWDPRTRRDLLPLEVEVRRFQSEAAEAKLRFNSNTDKYLYLRAH